jgi:S-methylmethionine-dependent homocysteine/selenocysteine methylase
LKATFHITDKEGWKENNMTAKYRNNPLPQLNGDLFLTDGGIETTLIFHEGFELPLFAAFDLLKDSVGRASLRKYFVTYAEVAKENGVGFILESPTWRASSDWGTELGYSQAAMEDVNLHSIQMLADIRADYESYTMPIVISGCVGPRGDGYNPNKFMTASEAEAYHNEQIKTFAKSDADMVTAITMTYSDEAIGVTRAAKANGMPVVISFTVETDGSLPSGELLKDAITAVDLATDNAPAYYMINCAHPTHFEAVIKQDGAWVSRIRGLRANASSMSHAELDEAEELDDGNPHELGQQYRMMRQYMKELNVLGGCCGTDHRHIESICKAFMQPG